MKDILISIVIPVYNGEKLIKRTVIRLLKQNYKCFEILLIDNNSSDRSYEKCCSLASKDKRIKVLKCLEKGTSLTRKMGIEHSLGEYIIIMDQDDRYNNKNSFGEMLNAIIEDGTDICQFSYYREYPFSFMRRITKAENTVIISADEMLKSELKGVMGYSGGHFDMTVWSKIYKASVLKEAVTHIHEPLFFAEDEYLNIWAFTSPMVQSVSARNEAYYCWKANSGFSSKHNGDALMKDYEIVKPLAAKIAETYCNDQRLLWYIHAECLFCMRAVIIDMISQKLDKKIIFQKIEEFSQLNCIADAKAYFNNYSDQRKIWSGLRTIISDYTCDEYYDYCCREIPKRTILGTINNYYLKGLKVLKNQSE